MSHVFKFLTMFGFSSEQSVQPNPNRITSGFSGHLSKTLLILTSGPPIGDQSAN